MSYVDVPTSSRHTLIRLASGLPLGGGEVPVNTVAPVISGTPTVGQTLSCTTGTWLNSPTSYTYVWYFNASPIAVGNTYILVSADSGGTMTCRVQATNASGSSAYVTSNALGPVTAGGGTLLVGETNGFATDFTYPVDADRVAVKTAGTVVSQGLDTHYTNTGTSPKYVYNAAGALVWAPHNMCLQSQTFDNAAWLKAVCTASANVTAAPNGLVEADAMIPNTGPQRCDFHIGPATLTGAVNTFSVYAKSGTLGSDWLEIMILATPTLNVWFNLATGAKGTFTGSPVAYTITSVGNGWHRLTVTFIAGAASAITYLAPDMADGSSTGITGGDGVKSACYLWGAQMNRGLTPTAYLPTTTAARVGVAIDHNPLTLAPKGMLVEPTVTNLITQSAAGGATPWVGNGSTLTAGQPDPSGGNEAMNVVTTNNALGVSVGKTGTTVAATTYTASMWCKGTLGQQIYFGVTLASQILVTFTGAWQRVSNTWAAAGTAEYVAFEGYNRSGGAHLPNVTFQVWGGQLETGTAATSYIPTTTATVIRAADNVTFPLSTIPALGSEYSVYDRFSCSNNTNRGVFVLTDGSLNNYVLPRPSSGTLNYVIVTSTVTQANNFQGTLVNDVPISTAIRVKTNDCAWSTGGSVIQVDTAVPLPPVTEVRFANSGNNGATLTVLNVQKLAIIPRGFTDVELPIKSAS